jgi:azurin
MKRFLSLAAVVFLLAACGNETTAPATHDNHAAAQNTTPPAAPAATGGNSIVLNGGDDMKFDQTAFTVTANEVVKLTLNHTGKMSKEAMGHNFVLLKPGTDINAFATEAIAAKDNNYVPANATAVLAHTKVLSGGESDTIEFTLAEKGEYPFICSFPGHSAIMKGIITVK